MSGTRGCVCECVSILQLGINMISCSDMAQNYRQPHTLGNHRDVLASIIFMAPRTTKVGSDWIKHCSWRMGTVFDSVQGSKLYDINKGYTN